MSAASRMVGTVTRFPVNFRCIDGAFLIGRSVRGGTHEGIRVVDGLPVIITHATDVKAVDDARQAVSFQAPNVAEFLGFGTIDLLSWLPGPGETEEDAIEWEDGLTVMPDDFVCVEAAPGGRQLDDVSAALSLDDIVALGLRLIELVEGLVSADRLLAAIRPETVWMRESAEGRWAYTGLTPRVWLLLSWGHMYCGMGFDLFDHWIPPDFVEERYGHTLPPDTDAFSVAAVLWYAACRRHPYAPTTREELPEPGVLRTYTGPPELYELLEPMLRYDHADRAPLEHLRRGLEDLARARGLDVPAREPVR